MIDHIQDASEPPRCATLCCYHPHDTPLATVAALDLEPGAWACCRCGGEAAPIAPGMEREEKTHGGIMETPEARQLRLMLKKRAGELNAAELFTLAAMRLGDLNHPKNHRSVRDTARLCADGLYMLVRLLLGMKQDAPSSVIEVPKLRIIDKNGKDVT